MSEIATYYYGRSTTNDRAYQSYRKKLTGCIFCKIDHPDNTVKKIVEELSDFWVIKNTFPYDVFDSIKVVDHLLIVPKKHIEGIAELTKRERIILIELISKYEAMGYSTMARHPGSQAKSIAHQHTHLIKLTDQPRLK
jgi:diadenosine tetraphosphate (Ap4A) HIT family hydrolase